MNKFSSSKIILEKEAVANVLKETRQSKELSLKTISEKLNINFRYLRYLEKGQFEKLPPGVYGKSFLKEYAIFLGLNYKDLMSVFDDLHETKELNVKRDIFSKQVIKKHNFLILPKIIKSFLLILAVTICLIYLGKALKEAVSPPMLSIVEPIDNLVTDEYFVNIIGVTEEETQVLVNGELTFIDDDGSFSKRVNLKNGLNKIIISAKKRYSQEVIVERQVMVESEVN